MKHGASLQYFIYKKNICIGRFFCTVNCRNFESLLGSGGSSGLANIGSSGSDGIGGGIPSGLPTAQPKFMSRGHLYKAVVGDTIELPCKVQNLGESTMKTYQYHIQI